MPRCLLPLALLAILAGSSAAQITTTPAFVGTYTEEFESLLSYPWPQCIPGRIFNNHGDACTPGGNMCVVTFGWLLYCSIYPHNGSNGLFGSAQGPVEYSFDSPAQRFGGYFGTNGYAPGGTAFFYDSANVLIGSMPITAPACSWAWNGWDAGAGPGFKRIVVYGNDPYNGGALLQMDDMEMDPISLPVPVLTAISPLSAPAGSAGLTLTCTGTDFQTTSVVKWSGASLPTTFVSSTQLTATVSAANLAGSGNKNVTVYTGAPGGGTSSAVVFTVTALMPTLTSINPTSATAGGASFTITASGTNFNAASTIRWNGTSLTTTYLSATQLTASVPAANILTGATVPITVRNPGTGGGTTPSLSFTVNNPAPVTTSLAPASAAEGSSAFTLTINGSGFIVSSLARWNGVDLPTTVVSATQITAAVPASSVASGGTATVTVFNGTPGGGTSAGLPFNILRPAPLLTSLSPNQVTAGDVAFTLTANGSGFSPASIVRWNGSGLPTTFVSSTQLSAAVSAGAIAHGGSFAISVQSPPPGGGTSGSLALDCVAPTILSLAPASLPVAAPGSPAATVTVTGAHFVPTSVVWSDGVTLATTFISPTQLQCAVPSSIPQVLRLGGLALTVRNGGTVLSNTRALVIGSGNNAGTIITDPPAMALPAGGTFNLVLEGGPPNQPFSLFGDASTTPFTGGFPDASTNFVLGVGSPAVLPLLDGIGLFGPSLGVAFGPNGGGTPPGGTFTLGGITAPSSPSGLSLTLQTIALDPSSPVGWRLGWAVSPRPF